MNNRLNFILIVFFIFFVNTAIAPAIQHDYISLTVTPGEELSRTATFSASYKRLFATADASGTAASWVTPKHLDFGAIDPGNKIGRDYTISVPTYQSPGYYELVWKFNCKYTDGSACSVTSDTVLQITVKATATPTVSKKQPIYLTVTQGDELTDYLTFTSSGDKYGLSAWADASGEAASWVTPMRLDFGSIYPGETSKRYYTIKAPDYLKPGIYTLFWKWGCKYSDGTACTTTDEYLSIQITVKAKPMPTYTRAYTPVYTPYYTPVPDQTTPIIIGFTLILVFFIIWLYIVVWVARDANKRGTSGTLWGILAFFLGLLGLLVYLIARPKGNFVLCDYCGKEKLETLTLCPHCKKGAAPAFEPAPVRERGERTVPYRPAVPQKPEAAVDDLKRLKEKLNKINSLLDKLDERLAQGEITEARYKELCEQYRAEAENLKNLVTEKELMQEVGLKTDEK